MSGIRNRRSRSVARLALVVGVVALPLAAAPASFGHKMSTSTARAVAKKKAQEIRAQTNSRSSTVRSCRRKSSHKVVCKVRSTYGSGLQTCITNVLVTYSGHRDRSPRAAFGPTRCS
jgi:hypothetical protein